MSARILAAVLCLACGGCAAEPDRRDAAVLVLDPELAGATESALGWWREATQIASTIEQRCEGERFCVYVSLRDLDTAGDQAWEPGANWSRVHIDPSVPPDARMFVVAHELGHSMGLFHVDAPGELMQQWGGTCIGEATLAEWRAEYGDGPWRTICREAP